MQYLKPELHGEVYEVRRTKTVVTKLDAPYTLFSIRGQASRVPVTSEVKGDKLDVANMHLQNLMPHDPSTAIDKHESVGSPTYRLPKEDDQKQETQGLMRQGHMQAERVLARYHRRKDEELGKLTRKEKRGRKLEASHTQSEKDEEKNLTITREAKNLSWQHPEISEMVTRKIARKAAQVKWQRSSEKRLHAKLAKTKDRSRFAVRFTSQEQESRGIFPQLEPRDDEPILVENETENAAPIKIKQYVAANSGNYKEKYGTMRLRTHDLKMEPSSVSESFQDYVKYESKPLQTLSHDSELIIKEESEGKSPGTACKGKKGSQFKVRKHATMNPFERLQAIRQVGEITSRDQAMVGLHGQYHLPLEQPKEALKS